MEDLKTIFMLDKFQAMSFSQKLAVVTAGILFALTFVFATGEKLVATTISAAGFWLATRWVERSGVDIEE